MKRFCMKCSTEQDMTKRIIGDDFCWWCPNCKDQIAECAMLNLNNTKEKE